jgi:hypothetical protein
MAEENRYIAAKASRPCFETDKHISSIELDPDSNAPLPSGTAPHHCDISTQP